jgi:hypothetical protein
VNAAMGKQSAQANGNKDRVFMVVFRQRFGKSRYASALGAPHGQTL